MIDASEHIIIQMSELNQDDSWDKDIPQTNAQLDPMSPKELLKVIGLLKKQQIATLKIKFSFQTEFDRKLFTELLKEEQNDEYFREAGQKKGNNIYNDKLKRKEMGFKENGFIFQIGSRLKSQIFLKAYRGNKLEELERNCNIKVHNFGRDLYIESNSKVRKGSIVHSELLDMYKRLKLFIFFNEEKLWNVVTNSEEFKKRLQKIGIHSYTNQGKRKHVAFYSFECQPEEIRKQILRQNSFEPRVLRLEDNQLSLKDNLRIFDVVVKSIRPTIDLIRNTYEANLEVNKNNSCFVLHLKHEVFAEEPVAEIARTVSNLLIISFPLRNCRSFINELKRNAKKYQFINATHYHKTTFCCIDRTKVKNKKDVLSIFAPFLEGLEQSSRLTLHLRPNCVLQQNSTVPSQVLDLAQKFKLDVEEYEKIMNGEKFNIVIKPKLLNNESKKSQKQLQFSKFLVELLLIQQNQMELTEDDLNESIINNSLITQENTDESGSKNNQRGNRSKARKKQYKTQILKQEIKDAMTVTNEREGRQGRGNRNNSNDQRPAQNNDQNRPVKFASEASQSKPEKFDWNLSVHFRKPNNLESNQLYKKQKRDGEVQEAIQNKEGIKVKCWTLKVNTNKFGFSQDWEQILEKQKCFLVEKLPNQAESVSEFELNYQNLSSLKDSEIGYLIYRAPGGRVWVPTHMVQRFQT